MISKSFRVHVVYVRLKNVCILWETDSIRERLRQNHHHSGLWAARSGLKPGAARSFFARWATDCPPCCLYLAHAHRGTRFPIPGRRFISATRSPISAAALGHVLIFSFKPVRRVHLDFATIRWKFCASLLSSLCNCDTDRRIFFLYRAKDDVHNSRVEWISFNILISCDSFWKELYIASGKLQVFISAQTKKYFVVSCIRRFPLSL